MSLLSNLKKQRKSQLEAATKAMESGGGQKTERKADERFWKLLPDDQGNAAAIIRFLPSVVEDELPWVKVDRYAFKGKTGKWYINNSLNTLGQKDPVAELNSYEWNEVGTDDAKNNVRRRKKQPKYIFNILVIKDVNHPENEGKVFLYEAGKQVFGWVQEKAQPEDDPLSGPVDPIYVWDLWEGANFRFKAYTEDPYLKYDKSSFDSCSELLGGDESKLEEILKQCHSLKQFVAPENFKTYEELEKELQRVEGNGTAAPAKTESLDNIPKSTPEKEAKKPKEEKKEPKAESAPASDESDDADLAYFKSLLSD